MQNPAIFSPYAPEPKRPRVSGWLPAWFTYLLLGLLFAGIFPNAFKERPTSAHVRTEAIVTSYVASTTQDSQIFSPKYAFVDQLGIAQEIQLNAFSDLKPFAIGERVPLYYLSSSPTQAFLVQDPYRDFASTLLRIVSLPFFFLAIVLLILRLRHVDPAHVRIATLVARFSLPWLILAVLVAAFVLFPQALPSDLHFSSGETSYSGSSEGFPSTLIAILAILGMVLWYVLRWPLLVVGLIRDLKDQYDQMKGV